MVISLPEVISSADLNKAIVIRRFEEKLLELFEKGLLNGTVHTCIGEEWCGVAIAKYLTPRDIVFSNHRGHGHYLSRFDDVDGLLAEVMGRVTGICGGVGGSQHIYREGFLSNGIQGGMVPVAVGHALVSKTRGEDGICVVFIGDGTTGEGTIYEAMNLASIWELPMLLVVENNGWAQSTETVKTIAGSIRARADAFEYKYYSSDTWNLETLFLTASEAIDFVRSNAKPALLEIKTFRLKAHSKGDDNRDPIYIARFQKKDILTQLLEFPDERISLIDVTANERIQSAFNSALGAATCQYAPKETNNQGSGGWRDAPAAWVTKERVANRIYEALRKQLEKDPSTVLIGEDVEGPYGGAFKVTRNLSALFPGRVISTPISEAALVGTGTGIALSGSTAIVEIMFGDFLTLGMDQLLNHASKFTDMYGAKLPIPLVVRTPMGGRRGYGPTHSQSIEKFFLGIPNVEVLALNKRFDPCALYDILFDRLSHPTIVIENKVLYTEYINDSLPEGYSLQIIDDGFSSFRLSPDFAKPELTILCYGGALGEVEASVDYMVNEFEVVPEIIVPQRLYPFDRSPLLESVGRTKALMIVEEGCGFAAFGAEAVAQIVEAGGRIEKLSRLDFKGIIPSSIDRERELLPGRKTILESVRRMFDA